MADIAVPTTSGVMDGIKGYAYGAVASFGYNLSKGLLGNFGLGGGLIGGAVAAGLASSIIKGPQGDAIATILGFQAVQDMAGGDNSGGGGGSGILDL